MTKKMLIDATHPEETRVAVVDGTRLEEFDFEIASRRQIKSNIYLAKVTRVEPSLQAAFVEYGGNRHGFLPFPEIHPDYYRIPVGDRRVYDRDDSWRDDRWRDDDVAPSEPSFAQERYSREQDHAGPDAAAADIEPQADDATPDFPGRSDDPEPDQGEDEAAAADSIQDPEGAESFDGVDTLDRAAQDRAAPDGDDAAPVADIAARSTHDPAIVETVTEGEDDAAESDVLYGEPVYPTEPGADASPVPFVEGEGDASPYVESVPISEEASVVDVVGGDEVEDAQRRRRTQMPHYKIQEVIKRRQIMLVQVSKEERGNKGAAVTTFLSLPGRYCVLMPNTSRGGGVSRKIANPADRKRMKELISDLEVPDGMSVILRTAGVERSKAEIKRDLEYLLRLWENIRTLTLESTAPALIYEEGNLVKRAIRDLYTKDIDSIEIAGEEGYRQAKDFMRMLMPSHAKRVQPYRDPSIPLFFRYQVETQIDLIHNPVAHLRSGGYIVINQTEALVSIDVNSGRSTRERNIEETALKTNCEAADEIARQLRLRDMGGLIVIDFIDMDEPRHDAQVERRLKEAMKNDRARIQVGRISPFGLLELSRQRLHPSLIETNFHTCAHCLGTGLVRSIESAALLVLRAIEEEGIKRRSAELAVTVPGNIALYILNQKRGMLIEIEQRYGFSVRILADDSLIAPDHRIERVRMKPPGSEVPQILNLTHILEADDVDDEEEAEEQAANPEPVAATPEASAETAAEGERKRKRRRNRRRRGRDGRPEEQQGAASDDQPGDESRDGEFASDDDGPDEDEAPAPIETETVVAVDGAEAVAEAVAGPQDEPTDGAGRRRRRGRRGGRSRPRRDEDGATTVDGVDESGESGSVAASGEDEPVEALSEDATGEAEAIALIAPTEPEPVETDPAEAPLPSAVGPDAPVAESASDATPEPENAAVSETAPAAEAPESPAIEVEAVEPEAPDAVHPIMNGADLPTQPSPAREYEVVNQPPEQPRRGWWKRLVE